jgi:GntR family transcriptional regulator, transcriptional repressor for pyruvate dehydrogenase complex
LLQHVKKRIQDGTWPPGHQLPPERDLVETFGVARNTLRKALEELKESGLIEGQVGRGTFVASGAVAGAGGAEALVARIHGASPTDVMELRLMLEPQFVESATVRATSSDLQHIQHCLKQSEKASGVLEFEHWDGMLHQAILAATQNRLLADIYEAINGVRRQPEWEALKRRSLTPERLALYRKQHRQLVKALVARNAAAARAAVNEHLLEVRAGLLGPG